MNSADYQQRERTHDCKTVVPGTCTRLCGSSWCLMGLRFNQLCLSFVLMELNCNLLITSQLGAKSFALRILCVNERILCCLFAWFNNLCHKVIISSRVIHAKLTRLDSKQLVSFRSSRLGGNTRYSDIR